MRKISVDGSARSCERQRTAPQALVVDFDPRGEGVVRRALTRIGLRVESAESWERAVELLADPASVYDLVVVDQAMCGTGSFKLVQRIHSIPHRAHLPVVIQTPAGGAARFQTGLEAGASYCVPKPFNQLELRTVVRAALSERSRRRARERQPRARPAALECLEEARFSFRTTEEAHRLATLLSAMCPDQEIVLIGLSELLINAVEHGNLGIAYAEKSALRRADLWEAEVARRLALPEYRHRRAQVALSRRTNRLVFTITDQGLGFDWRKYMRFDPRRACDLHGRGIALARSISFEHLAYRDPGNVVEAAVSLLPLATGGTVGEAPAFVPTVEVV